MNSLAESDLSRGQKKGNARDLLHLCSLVPWTNLCGAGEFIHSPYVCLTPSAPPPKIYFRLPAKIPYFYGNCCIMTPTADAKLSRRKVA